MNSPANSIWIGYDSKAAVAFAVAKYSIRRFDKHTPIFGLVLEDLRTRGLYTRPTETLNGKMWDLISDAAMSTEFSNSRFLVPHLARTGLALFCDSDFVFMESIARLFEMANAGKAVYCVKHKHQPPEHYKMDGQIQTQYHRKNWSSLMLFDCDHPSNKKLTLEMINTLPGRDLHRFCWLDDDEIGDLPPEWNYLVGYNSSIKPKGIHFTNGLPDVDGYQDQEFADIWLNMKTYAVGAL